MVKWFFFVFFTSFVIKVAAFQPPDMAATPNLVEKLNDRYYKKSKVSLSGNINTSGACALHKPDAWLAIAGDGSHAFVFVWGKARSIENRCFDVNSSPWYIVGLYDEHKQLITQKRSALVVSTSSGWQLNAVFLKNKSNEFLRTSTVEVIFGGHSGGINIKGAGNGIVGDVIRATGRATGVKDFERFGDELDYASFIVKDLVPVWAYIEEEASEFVKKRFLDACNIPYQAITNAVITRCSNWDERLSNQNLIDEAIDLLVKNGYFLREEFHGIQIRWCALVGAEGMAPDRGRIYLDVRHKDVGKLRLSSLLAHEMIHVRQYRRMGSDKFKCEYSRKLIQCGNCQNNNHSMEKEAYEFENMVFNDIEEFPDESKAQNRETLSGKKKTPVIGKMPSLEEINSLFDRGIIKLPESKPSCKQNNPKKCNVKGCLLHPDK